MAGIHLAEAAGAAEEGVQKRFHIIGKSVGDGSHKYIRCDRLSEKVSGTETRTHGALRTYAHGIPDIHFRRTLAFADRQTVRRQDQKCLCRLGDNIIQAADPSGHGASHQRYMETPPAMSMSSFTVTPTGTFTVTGFLTRPATVTNLFTTLVSLVTF